LFFWHRHFDVVRGAGCGIVTLVVLHEALTLSQWAGVLAILGTGVFVGLTEKAPKS
jgi:hypothetical protein